MVKILQMYYDGQCLLLRRRQWFVSESQKKAEVRQKTSWV